MTKKTVRNTGEKFYFNVNIFDEGYVDPTIPVEPLPPVYSEQDLQSAQQQAFERGRQQGLKESAESRAQQVAQILARISQDMARLFTAEAVRDKQFEKESLHLAAALLEKLFPALHAKYGMDELKEAITGVLRAHEGAGEVAIEVHPGDLNEINAALEKLPVGATPIKYTVRGNDALGPHACRIGWKDGGAVRDSQALAAQIEAIIQETLAGGQRSGHNRDNSAQAGTVPAKQEE